MLGTQSIHWALGFSKVLERQLLLSSPRLVVSSQLERGHLRLSLLCSFDQEQEESGRVPKGTELMLLTEVWTEDLWWRRDTGEGGRNCWKEGVSKGFFFFCFF